VKHSIQKRGERRMTATEGGQTGGIPQGFLSHHGDHRGRSYRKKDAAPTKNVEKGKKKARKVLFPPIPLKRKMKTAER